MSTGDTTQSIEDSKTSGAASKVLVIRWVGPDATGVDCLQGASVLVGRGEDCTLRLASEGVSRRHAEIHRQGPVFAIRDLGSRNGTFLNGRRVVHNALAPGDVLRLGSAVGVFAAVEPARATIGFDLLGPALFGGPELDQALSPARRVAESDLSVVVIGATGTGKERVAQAIHEWSRRRGELHAVNCAALPANLAEAELFGYRKGAFTGAERDGLGHVRAADGGTLFLDEIADLPLPVQAKLLRVVEERRVTPLGDTKPISVDLRIIAAFQKPPAELVAGGAFREDLAARLAGVTVELPPLSSRRADAALLFQEFLRRHSGGRPPRVDAKLLENLCLYEWPRNVRELEQLARQMLVLHGLEPLLQRQHLPEHVRLRLEDDGVRESVPPHPDESRRDYDIRRLVAALRANRGNIKDAAKNLGFSRQRAYRLMNGRSVDELLNDASLSQPAGEGSGE